MDVECVEGVICAERRESYSMERTITCVASLELTHSLSYLTSQRKQGRSGASQCWFCFSRAQQLSVWVRGN